MYIDYFNITFQYVQIRFKIGIHHASNASKLEVNAILNDINA